MYCQHFSLKKKPFQISPDNSFLWLGDKHAQALTLLKTGMAQNQGLMTLIGDVGTGKTTLLNEIIHTLDNEALYVKIADPYFEINLIYQVIAHALGFEHQKQKKKSSSFYSFLQTVKNKKVVVIVDEAQRISQHFLKEIISWTKFGFNEALTIILAGQLEFQDVLNASQNKTVQNDDIKVKAFLEPLNEQETMAYIKRRLELAGTNQNIFLETTVHEIYNYSKGIPRLINISCDQALITAFADNLKIVDVPTFQQAIKSISLPDVKSENQLLKTEDQLLENRPPPARQRSILIFFAGLAVGACIFLAYLFYTDYFPPSMDNKNTDYPSNKPFNQPVEVESVKQPPAKVQVVKQTPLEVQPVIPKPVETQPVIPEVETQPVVPESITMQAVEKELEKIIPSETIDPLLDVKEDKPDIINKQQSDDLISEKLEKLETELGYKPSQLEDKLDYTSEPDDDYDPEAIIDWLLGDKKSN